MNPSRLNYADIHVRRTAGYFIYVHEIWANGPDLLCSFGMSGPLNLIWAYLLATKRPELLTIPPGNRVVMMDIVVASQKSRPESRSSIFPAAPATLDFANDWRLDDVVDYQEPA